MTSQPWERQTGETSRAYECFSAFRDAGKSRLLIDVYRSVTGVSQACKLSGTWNGWIKAWDWWARAEAYDAYCDRQLLEDQLQEKREAHRQALEEFRQAHLQTARHTFANFGKILKQIDVFLRDKETAITSWDDAVKAGRVMDVKNASEVWADALGISTLLDQVDGEES